jgi:hypothetical protein
MTKVVIQDSRLISESYLVATKYHEKSVINFGDS